MALLTWTSALGALGWIQCQAVVEHACANMGQIAANARVRANPCDPVCRQVPLPTQVEGDFRAACLLQIFTLQGASVLHGAVVALVRVVAHAEQRHQSSQRAFGIQDEIVVAERVGRVVPETC